MANTKLLSHFNGAQDQTTYTTTTGNACSFTGTAKLDTTQIKFGSSSVRIDASGYVYLADSTDWALGSGSFTIDCWAYLNESVGQKRFLLRYGGDTTEGWGTGGDVWNMYFSDNSKFYFQYADSSSFYSIASNDISSLTTGWHHFATTKDSGNTTRIFLDGSQISSLYTPTSGLSPSYACKLKVGGWVNTSSWNGWIDEVRYKKGIADWTSNFIPPTLEYSNIETQPVDQTLAYTSSSSLSVSVISTGTPHYVWTRDGTAVGTDSSVLSLTNFHDTSRGVYKVTSSALDGTFVSNDARVISRPSIVYQPDSLFCNYGENRTLEILCDGYTPITYQWRKDGSNISNATDRTYTITNYSESSSGRYSVVATAAEGGSVTSTDSIIKTKQQSLLANFDGTQGQNVYTADSGQVLTFSGTAIIDTTRKMFGTSSLYIGGGSGNYVTVPDSSEWQFGTSDYIIETWYYLNESPSNPRNLIMYCGASTDTYDASNGVIWHVYLSGGKRIVYRCLYDNSGHYHEISAATDTLNPSYNWHHLAVVKNDGTIALFSDGKSVIISTTPDLGVINPTSGTHYLRIGLYSSVTYSWNGWIDGIRIWKGFSVWPFNPIDLSYGYFQHFYPPSLPYTFRPGPEHYYINADATMRDGLTPSTGYKSFLELFMYKGQAQPDWTIDVINSTASIDDLGRDVYLCGVVRAYVSNTFPVIALTRSGTGTYCLKSNTTIIGLKFTASAGFANNRPSLFMPYPLPSNDSNRKGVINIVIDGCKFERLLADIQNLLVSNFDVNTPNSVYSVTIRNCTFFKMDRMYFSPKSYAPGQKLVYVNNSNISGGTNNYIILFINNTDFYWYNNYSLPSISYYPFIRTDTLPSRAKGYVDAFYYHQTSFFPPFIDNTNNVTVGNYGDRINAFSAQYPSPDTPGQIAITNKDFSLSYSSSLKNLGIANSYTPSTDIRCQLRDSTYDVGAYEYIPIIINRQPSDQRVSYGNTLNFSIDATGTASLHYQWKKDNSNVGTDSSVYTAADFGDSSRGRYKVVITCIDSTNADGTHTLTSNEVVAAGQWYINSGSSTSNGLTPSTGFHNFTDLIAFHGNLSTLDTVDVVYSGIDSTDSTQIMLSGLIRPYVTNTFPVISNNMGIYDGYILETDTTVTGLYFKTSFSDSSRKFIQFDGTGISLLGNKIYLNNTDSVSNPVIMTGSTNAVGPISIQNNSLWIKTLSTSTSQSLCAVNFQLPSWTSNNIMTLANNSFYVDESSVPNMQFIVALSHQLYSYNNIFYFKNSTDSSTLLYNATTSANSYENNNIRYNFNGTLYSGNMTIGGSDLTSDPLYKDGQNNDLSITKVSPAVRAATTNSYTTLTDIRGQVKTYTNDIGAYGLAAPIITGQPTITQFLYVGNSLFLHVDATSYDPIHFQWVKDGSIIGTDSSDYSKIYSNIDKGVYYINVTVNDLTATSNNATIDTLTSIITQPVSKSIKIDYSLTLDTTAVGQEPYTYQWYKDNTVISGATGQQLYLSRWQDSNRGLYKVVIYNNSLKDFTSNDATVTTAVDFVVNPLSKVASLGDNVEFSVAATGHAPLSYQWYHDSTPVGTNSSFLSLSNYSDSSKGNYTATVYSPDFTATSNVASLYTNQRTFYLNAVSATQDGSSPSTGYHNFASLISARGSLRSTDVVRIVYSGTDIVDTGRIALAGSIRPDVTGTFPVIYNTLAGDHGYDIKADSIVTGLYIKSDTSNYQYSLIRFDGTNASIYGNKISHYCMNSSRPPFTITETTAAIGPLSIKNNSIWVKSFAGGIGGSDYFYVINLSSASWNTSCVLSLANNSFYIDSPLNPVDFRAVYTTSHRCFNYNNIYYAITSVNTNGILYASAPMVSYEDYNIRFNFNNYFYSGNNYVQGSYSFISTPRYKNGPSKDLSLLNSSPAINAATTNAFTTTSDIRGNLKTLSQDTGAYNVDGTFIPGQWYINNSSSIQDGTTAETGCRNFSGLFSKIDQLTSNDYLYIVYTGVDTTDNGSINLAGKISSYTNRSFPAISNTNGSYILAADTTITGLTFKTDQTASANFIQYNGPRSAIIGNKIIHRSNHSNAVALITATSSSAGLLTLQNNSIWSKATTPSSFYQIKSTTATLSNDCTLNLTNNSFYIDFTSSADAQTIVSQRHRLYSYNNIFYFKNSTTSYMYNVSTNATYMSYEDYNLRYGWSGTYSTGQITIGSHDISGNDPLYKDGANGNLALQKNSPAANTAITNSFTPLTDIVGLSKTYSNDIGAYEIAYPIIISNPTSQKAEIGNTLTISTDATSYDGTNVHYQWKKDGTNIGSDSSIYSKIYADIDRGIYRVNAIANDRTATSNDATITTQPVFTLQPSSQGVILGGLIKLDTTVSGHSPITYQWIKDGTNLSGATDNSLTLTSFADSSRGIYKIVAYSDGNDTTSTDATLTVQPVFTLQPSSQGVILGGLVKLDTTVSGHSPITYQWIKDGTNLSGATDNSLTLTSFADSSRGIYKIVAYSDGNDTTSTDATLTVQPYISTQPVTQAFELGSAASLDVTAIGHIPFTYQWYKDSTILSGAIGNPLILTPFADNSRGSYNVVVFSDGNDTTSTDATLTVKPTIILQPISQKFEIDSSAYLYVSAIGHEPVTYQWYKDSTFLSGATDTTLSLTPFKDSSGGRYKATANSDGNMVDSSEALIVSNITILTEPDTTATQRIPYSYYPYALGGVISHWELTGAPSGMLFDSTTGAISWTPGMDQTNSGPLRLTVFDDSTDFQDWTISVAPGVQGNSVISPDKIFIPTGGLNIYVEIPSNRVVYLQGGFTFYV